VLRDSSVAAFIAGRFLTGTAFSLLRAAILWHVYDLGAVGSLIVLFVVAIRLPQLRHYRTDAPAAAGVSARRSQ
jgi:hypothetical protein